MRKFVVGVVVAVLAWIFVVPSCSTTFGCASAPATANADSGTCPNDTDVEALLRGTTLVVWWPGGKHRTLTGKANS